MPLTDQEIFDKVTVHLLTQNKKSLAMDGERSICAYRGENGTSCAVGCLIPDSIYSPDLEGVVCGSASVVSALIMADVLSEACYEEAFTNRTVQLLSELQGIHDACPPAEWQDKLYHLARVKELTMPSVP